MYNPFCSAVCLLIAVSLLAAARAPGATPDFGGLEALVAAELARHQVPGCAVAVVADGDVALARGFGVASVETGAPVTPDMLFRIGSTTKMFTAAGLVLLARDGKLELNAPIGRYATGLDPAVARLTAHQVLSHTAGLADPNAMEGPHDESALAGRVRALGARDFFDEPGRIYSYSNAGFWIAGFIIQEVSGRPYADHLQERIFKPLGLERTTFRPTMAMTWPFAIGHGPEGSAVPQVIRPLADNAAVWPAGQLFTTAPEFARFCIAFMADGQLEGREVLPPFVIERLSAPQTPVPNSDRHYGYGLGLRTEGGLRWVSHSGSRTGYGSLVRMCPEKRFAVIILCNKTGANLPRVAERAEQIVLGVRPPPSPAREHLAMTAKEMARYAGTYSSGRSTLVLRVRDGRLVAATGGAVSKVGARLFVRAATGTTPALEFSLVTDTQDRVTHLIAKGRAWRKTS